jgi:hypothetical protein
LPFITDIIKEGKTRKKKIMATIHAQLLLRSIAVLNNLMACLLCGQLATVYVSYSKALRALRELQLLYFFVGRDAIRITLQVYFSWVRGASSDRYEHY